MFYHGFLKWVILVVSFFLGILEDLGVGNLCFHILFDWVKVMWFDSVVYDDDHDFNDYDLVTVWMFFFCVSLLKQFTISYLAKMICQFRFLNS